jgi:hypothetical protein
MRNAADGSVPGPGLQVAEAQRTARAWSRPGGGPVQGGLVVGVACVGVGAAAQEGGSGVGRAVKGGVEKSAATAQAGVPDTQVGTLLPPQYYVICGQQGVHSTGNRLARMLSRAC